MRVSGEVRRPDYRPAPGERDHPSCSGVAGEREDGEPRRPPREPPATRVAYEDATPLSSSNPRAYPPSVTPREVTDGPRSACCPTFSPRRRESGRRVGEARPRAQTRRVPPRGVCWWWRRRAERWPVCASPSRIGHHGRDTARCCAVTRGRTRRSRRRRRRGPLRPRGNVSASHPGASVITLPLSGQPCETHWRSVAVVPSERYGALTLVDMWPKTGRTHQLRRHASEALRRPIVGDAYTKGETKGGLDDSRGLFLWAVELSLPARAMPWREEDGGTAEDGGTRGGVAGSRRERVGGFEGVVTRGGDEGGSGRAVASRADR